MADKTIDHYQVAPALLQDIATVLNQIPGPAARGIMNRIENITGTAECAAVLALPNKQPADPPPADPPAKTPRKKKAAKKARKRSKVARKRGGN